MILYDSVNLEITSRYSIASDKKGGKPTKHSNHVGSVTIDSLIDSKELDNLVETVQSLFKPDGISVTEIKVSTKTSSEFD